MENKISVVEKNKCPCDSVGTFTLKNKIETVYYFGKSLIKTKTNLTGDTVEITRFYTSDSVWHVQEYLVVSNNKIADPIFSIYCDFKDSASFYRLTFIRNEEIDRGQQSPKVDRFYGIEAILGVDTLRSTTNSIVIPKTKFIGLLKIDKKVGGVYNGDRLLGRHSVVIEAENMIKYGSLLEQYKAINRLCNNTVGNKKLAN